jgi:hypothetical protein
MRKVMQNVQFSHATLNPSHLLEISIPYLRQFENDELLKRVEYTLSNYTVMDFQIAELWEEVFEYLDTHSAVGYYFGATEGDGSDIGWWPHYA